MSLPSNPTRAFIARNPHLYGRPTVAENATVDPDAVPAGQEGALQRDIAADLDARRWAYVWHRMDCPTTTAKGVPDFVVAAHPLLWRCPGCNWCRPMEGRPTCSDCGTALLPVERTLWIECKTRTGKLSTDQLLFRQRLEANGHVLHVVRSLRECLEIAG